MKLSIKLMETNEEWFSDALLFLDVEGVGLLDKISDEDYSWLMEKANTTQEAFDYLQEKGL